LAVAAWQIHFGGAGSSSGGMGILTSSGIGQQKESFGT